MEPSRRQSPSWEGPAWLADKDKPSRGAPPLVPWDAVRAAWAGIDGMYYHVSVQAAQDDLLSQASPCKGCGRPPVELFWLPVATADHTWAAGRGQVGWVTICRECRLQVSLIPDRECTFAEAECRGLGPQTAGKWEWDGES